jgi:hypothetical protein
MGDLYEVAASETAAEPGTHRRSGPGPALKQVTTDPDAAPARAAAWSPAAMTTSPDLSGPAAQSRKRGRPALMTRDQLVASIRDLAGRPDGLFRVHLTDSDLYARARRMFGSWAAAVAAAGVDYGQSIDTARRRSLESRRRGA